MAIHQIVERKGAYRIETVASDGHHWLLRTRYATMEAAMLRPECLKAMAGCRHFQAPLDGAHGAGARAVGGPDRVQRQAEVRQRHTSPHAGSHRSRGLNHLGMIIRIENRGPCIAFASKQTIEGRYENDFGRLCRPECCRFSCDGTSDHHHRTNALLARAFRLADPQRVQWRAIPEGSLEP